MHDAAHLLRLGRYPAARQGNFVRQIFRDNQEKLVSYLRVFARGAKRPFSAQHRLLEALAYDLKHIYIG
jgi:hypothetical protein